MARIDREELEHVAALARLTLSDAEADSLAVELDSILGYVETLKQLDISDVEPTSHPTPLPTPLRDDVPEPGIDPHQAVANAPETAEFSFVVPRVIDSESEG